MYLALRPICCSPEFVTSFFTVSRKDQEQTFNGLQSLVCSCHQSLGCRKEGTEDSGWGFCCWSFLFLAAAFGVTDWIYKWTVTRQQLKIEPWPLVYSNQLTTPPRPPYVLEASLLLYVRCVGCQATVWNNCSRKPNTNPCKNCSQMARAWLITHSFPNFYSQFQFRTNRRKLNMHP